MTFVKLEMLSGDVIINVSEIELIVENPEFCQIFFKSGQIVEIVDNLATLQQKLGILA